MHNHQNECLAMKIHQALVTYTEWAKK